ncbi:helix-hairpin-helix domain-containing protein [Magnetofaba australis]|uniref:Pathogenicity locus n=1 Tax=Magnetofaba australis IT-1 TaxID=1434232 RepID=A0A1Y2K569_9PROT|nr:helix-hairpin-helix domain-containing protein [Magnetofaba australis]OSM04113.1 hypothetical protein MAIT1_03620 [Magnetofaba australis IT-1]
MKLPLHDDERRALRGARVRLGDVADLGADALGQATGIAPARCAELTALARFQRLGSVGPSLAADLWRLGYADVENLCGENPAQMYTQFCELVGQRVDPCVEDVFRCAVAQAQNPELPEEQRQWWFWTPMRGQARVDEASPGR